MQKEARKITAFHAKKKKVNIDVDVIVEEDAEVDGTSTYVRPSRGNLLGGFTSDVMAAIDLRKAVHAYDDTGKDVTPKLIYSDALKEQFKKLRLRVSQSEERIRRETLGSKIQSQSRMGFKLSMDDIIGGIDDDPLSIYRPSFLGEAVVEETDLAEATIEPPLPYCKIILRRTDDILLYEQQCMTALRNTKEGDEAEEDNKAYLDITVGKGKLRRRSDADSQTQDILRKSRDVNTENVIKSSKDSYVSNFEMYDTIKALEKTNNMTQTTPLDTIEEEDSGQGTDQQSRIESQLAAIFQSQSFNLSSMLIRRFLASNNFEAAQRRFRNMSTPDPLSLEHNIRYNLNLLFRFETQSRDSERKAVTDLSWCSKNSDILAAGYGIYSFSAMHVPKSGYVCVWSIKNPGNAERCYFFNVPVVCVAFSPTMATLLAVGLYDGSIEVFDITNPNEPSIAVTQRSLMLSCEPVMKIKWIEGSKDEQHDFEPFLAVSQSSTVTKHRIINSPYLLTFQQMALERDEGKNEKGTKGEGKLITQANRHPQGLDLTLHPTQSDIYYVLTDEGCMHKCSTNYPHQHLEVAQAHTASVNNMDFCPWSSSLFLTSGNDWTTRIWLDGVLSPLITLSNSESLPVHCAYWSRTHSTVIIELNRKTVDIWDLQRSVLHPVNSVSIDSSFHTTCRISNSGTTLALGNERGNILMCAFDDFPFRPHMQFDVLESAILKAVSCDELLSHEVKARGLAHYKRKGAHIIC